MWPANHATHPNGSSEPCDYRHCLGSYGLKTWRGQAGASSASEWRKVSGGNPLRMWPADHVTNPTRPSEP
eukprot:8121071-Pyramimonas_sp.AAC.1